MTDTDQDTKSQKTRPAAWGDTDRSLRDTIEEGDKRNLKRDLSLIQK